MTLLLDLRYHKGMAPEAVEKTAKAPEVGALAGLQICCFTAGSSGTR
jgi:hypothetical protein